MKVQNSKDAPQQEVKMEGASGCTVRQLVNEDDGAPTFAMRQFEVSPGGYTPRHSHPYEHEVYVLEGEGEVYEGDTPHPLKKGDVILVKPDEVHQFKNTGDGPMQFLCLVPNSFKDLPISMAPECSVE